MKTLLRKPEAVLAFLPVLVLGLGVAQSARCNAQTPTPPDALPKVAALHEPRPVASDPAATDTASAAAKTATGTPAAKTEAEVSRDIAAELAVMKVRIEQLEAELKSHAPAESTPEAAATPAPAKSEPATPATASAAPAAATVQASSDTPSAKPGKPEPTAPFAYADWTWLNGNRAQ